MKINNLIKASLILAPLLLAGCASDSKKTVNLNLHYVTADSAPIEAGDRVAQAQIAAAASSVDQSLNELSAIKMQTHPGTRMPAPLNSTAVGMDKKASVDWYGPAEPIVRKLARVSQYKVRVLGNEPATPVFVNISSQDQHVSDILRDVTYQAAGKADIKVYPSKKVVELRYRP